MPRRDFTARPQAIDDMTGFKVNYSSLKRQWDGFYTNDPDRRNPQDLLKGRADNPKLDHPRPEPADVFLASNITLEDGQTLIVLENGNALLGEGHLNGDGL